MNADELRSLEAQADAYQAQADEDRRNAPYKRISALEEELAECNRSIKELCVAREAADEELADGDYWQERAKKFMESGGCPVCFASDEAGHEDGCPWGQAESRLSAAVKALESIAVAPCLYALLGESEGPGLDSNGESCGCPGCAALAALKEAHDGK